MIKKDDVMSIPAGASPEQINKIDDGINGYLKKMFGTVDYDEYWSAYGKPARPNFDDYFVYYVSPKGKKSYYKDKFKGASDEWSRINREHYDAIEEWKASFDYAAANAKYEELESAAAKRKAHFSYVSDCLDAATMGTVTTFMGYGGHGYDYYHKPTHTSSNSQNETFANIFTMLANNDSEAVRQMSTLLPSVYNAFLDQMEVKFGG